MLGSRDGMTRQDCHLVTDKQSTIQKKKETSFFKEDLCRLVLDFVGGGGGLNNNYLFYLMGSEIGVDCSTSVSATSFLNCSIPFSSAEQK